MTDTSQGGERFFFVAAWAMLALVVGSFGLRALLLPEELPPASLALAGHVVVMTSWYGLLVVQVTLVRARSVGLHRRFGQASVILAIGVLGFGWLVTLDAFARSGDGVVAMANGTSLGAFALLYGAALWKRRDSSTHKRFILLASIRMLAPAFVRVTLVLSASEAFTAVGIAIGVGAVVVYDVRRLRRIHPATVLGTVVVVLTLVAVPTFGQTRLWMELLAALTR